MHPFIREIILNYEMIYKNCCFRRKSNKKIFDWLTYVYPYDLYVHAERQSCIWLLCDTIFCPLDGSHFHIFKNKTIFYVFILVDFTELPVELKKQYQTSSLQKHSSWITTIFKMQFFKLRKCSSNWN